MGYYSDVRIRTTKKGFEALKNEVEKYTKEKGIKNLLDFASRVDTYLDVVTIDWTFRKWYSSNQEEQAIINSLSKIQEQGYSWVFARIGEDYTDIEIEENIQENDDELYEDLCISINRSFED